MFRVTLGCIKEVVSMLKREPSKLVIEGNQFYIPWVYCVIQDNFIDQNGKSL